MSRTVHKADFQVLLVAKAPVPGSAKTRLCPPATPEHAAEIAAASLLDTLDTLLHTPGAVPTVALAGHVDHAARGPELAAMLRDVSVIRQCHGDLGRRLARALADAATLHPGVPTVLVGMDTPQLTAGLLTGAATRMCDGRGDAVLGEATDGGWWLLGLREPANPAVLHTLSEIPMSRADTGTRTMHSLHDAGLRVNRAPRLSDVDTMLDAVAVAETIPGSRFATTLSGIPREWAS